MSTPSRSSTRDPDFPADVVTTRTTATAYWRAPTGRTPVTLGADEDIDTVDFGYAGGGAIGDTVWFDRNGDGVIDADEPASAASMSPSSGYGEDGTFGEAATTRRSRRRPLPTATYLIDGLPSGVFDVSVTDRLPPAWSPTFDADGGDDSTSRGHPRDSTRSNLDQDFGYRGTGLIGDTCTSISTPTARRIRPSRGSPARPSS